MPRNRLVRRLIYATGCFVALAVSVLFHAYLGFTIPLGGVWGLEPYDFQELVARNSIVEFVSAGGYSLFLPLAWCGGCALIAVLQRGQDERYDGWVLASCALAVLGGSMAIDGTYTSMKFDDYRPIGLLQLAIGAMWLSALVGSVRLVVLVLRKSPRRGRAWALYCAGWGGGFGWIVFSLILQPPAPTWIDDGIELPRVARRDRHYPSYFDSSRSGLIVCAVNREGQVRIDGELVWAPSDGEDDQRLEEALRLAKRAADKISEGVEPELRLRADVNAPCDSVVRVLEYCSATGTYIWMISLAVSRQPDIQAGAPDVYGVTTYLSDTGGMICWSPPFDTLPEELVIRVGPDPGGFAFEYGDLRTTDMEVLRSTLRNRLEARDDEDEEEELARFFVRTHVVDGDLRWGQLMDFFLELHRIDGKPAPFLSLGRFKLLGE